LGEELHLVNKLFKVWLDISVLWQVGLLHVLFQECLDYLSLMMIIDVNKAIIED
jgi:hypothetical protein